MNPKRQISCEQAREIGDQLGVDWSRIDLEEFRRELEFGAGDSQTSVTTDDLHLTGKIARAHLKPGYGSLHRPRPAKGRGE